MKIKQKMLKAVDSTLLLVLWISTHFLHSMTMQIHNSVNSVYKTWA